MQPVWLCSRSGRRLKEILDWTNPFENQWQIQHFYAKKYIWIEVWKIGCGFILLSTVKEWGHGGDFLQDNRHQEVEGQAWDWCGQQVQAWHCDKVPQQEGHGHIRDLETQWMARLLNFDHQVSQTCLHLFNFPCFRPSTGWTRTAPAPASGRWSWIKNWLADFSTWWHLIQARAP